MQSKWNELIQRQIEKHIDKVQKVTKPLRDHFGISYFTYHRIDSKGNYSVLLDRPEWAEHYVESRYYEFDPYLREYHNYRSGLCAMHMNGSKEYQKEIILGGKKVLNANFSVILIEKKEDHVEFFGFSGDIDSSSIQEIAYNNPNYLKAFSQYFRTELEHNLTQIQQEPYSLTHLKGADFKNTEKIHVGLTHEKKYEFLKQISKGYLIEGLKKLSPRQKECLKMIGLNKSNSEIALKLNLSKRTVESYLEEIKAKLSCHFKSELYVISKELADFDLI